MAALQKFDSFLKETSQGIHNFEVLNHDIQLYFTNATPDLAAHSIKGHLPGITEQNGYVATNLGNDILLQPTVYTTGVITSIGVLQVIGINISLTATAGSFGPFRYAVICNASLGLDDNERPLIGFWDYEMEVSVLLGESFIVAFESGVIFDYT